MLKSSAQSWQDVTDQRRCTLFSVSAVQLPLSIYPGKSHVAISCLFILVLGNVYCNMCDSHPVQIENQKHDLPLYYQRFSAKTSLPCHISHGIWQGKYKITKRDKYLMKKIFMYNTRKAMILCCVILRNLLSS